MANATLTAASTSWPDAAIAIAGIALAGSFAAVVVWQALATWRTRMAVRRDEAYRRLAEQTARGLQEINERLAERERQRPSEGHER